MEFRIEYRDVGDRWRPANDDWLGHLGIDRRFCRPALMKPEAWLFKSKAAARRRIAMFGVGADDDRFRVVPADAPVGDAGGDAAADFLPDHHEIELKGGEGGGGDGPWETLHTVTGKPRQFRSFDAAEAWGEAKGWRRDVWRIVAVQGEKRRVVKD